MGTKTYHSHYDQQYNGSKQAHRWLLFIVIFLRGMWVGVHSSTATSLDIRVGVRSDECAVGFVTWARRDGTRCRRRLGDRGWVDLLLFGRILFRRGDLVVILVIIQVRM
jgi:hypothetical protein